MANPTSFITTMATVLLLMSLPNAGVGERGLCLGVVWGDFNDDGYPDLYVVNDFGRKTLYRNNRKRDLSRI